MNNTTAIVEQVASESISNTDSSVQSGYGSSTVNESSDVSSNDHAQASESAANESLVSKQDEESE